MVLRPKTRGDSRKHGFEDSHVYEIFWTLSKYQGQMYYAEQVCLSGWPAVLRRWPAGHRLLAVALHGAREEWRSI